MKSIAFILMLLPSLSFSQFCSNCIYNSAAPQNAQMNITSATIRGTLTVGTLNLSTFSVTVGTATQFYGGGAGLTGLNASNLASGTVSTTVVAGQYFGVTGVGALSTGTWTATKIGTQYGGTGQNFVNVSTGSLIYFSTVGVMATLSPGTPEALLQTNGNAAPAWTSAPAVSGANIYGINPFQLAGGSLPTNVIVSSNSIPYVNAASVFGVLNATATYFTGPVQLSQLVAGTLSSSVVASSITGTGISKGVYGDSSHALQISYGTDGRASTITVLNLSVPLADLQSGTLASGILVPAANIQAGTLGASVVASSIAASGITPGTYGGGAQLMQCTFGADGRATSCAQYGFAGPVSGTGATGQDAIWASSSVLTGGLLTETLGRVNILTGAVQSTFTATGSLQVPYGVVASTFTGDGSAITHAGAGAGAIPFVTTAGSTLTFNANGLSFDPIHQRLGIRTANPLHGIDCSSCTLYLDGNSPNPIQVGNNGSTMTLTSAGNLTVSGTMNGTTLTASVGLVGPGPAITGLTAANLTGQVATLNGGTGQNWGSTATGGVPYFSSVGTMNVLAAGTNGQSMTLVGGVPTWSSAVSSSTDLSGGGPGSLPYQSGPSATVFLSSSVNGYALQQTAGVPSWVAAVTSATNVVGGAANSVHYQSAANTTAMLAAGAGVLQEVASGAPAWTTTPTLTGTNITGVPAASILSGSLGSAVIASSVAVGSIANAQTAAGTFSNVSIPAANVNAGSLGASVIASSVAVGAVGTLQLASGALISSATNIAGGSNGSLPYQSAANTTALLAPGTTGYSLTVASTGRPAWAAAVSSATNIAGGAANSLPYQSAANTTAMLAAGTGALYMTAGVPAWNNAPPLSAANFTNIPSSFVYTNTQAGVILSTWAVGAEDLGDAMDGQGRLYIVTNLNTVAVLSSTGALITTISEPFWSSLSGGIAYNPTDGKVYVVNIGSGTFDILTSSYTVGSRIQTSAALSPGTIAFDQNGVGYSAGEAYSIIFISTNVARSTTSVYGLGAAAAGPHSFCNDGFNEYGLMANGSLIQFSTFSILNVYTNAMNYASGGGGIVCTPGTIYYVLANPNAFVAYQDYLWAWNSVTLSSSSVILSSGTAGAGGDLAYDFSGTLWAATYEAHTLVQAGLDLSLINSTTLPNTNPDMVHWNGQNVLTGSASGTNVNLISGAQLGMKQAANPTSGTLAAAGIASSLRIGMNYTSTTACATAASCTATCPGGTYVMSCGATDSILTLSPACYASSPTTCTCNATAGTGTITVYPVCGRAQ